MNCICPTYFQARVLNVGVIDICTHPGPRERWGVKPSNQRQGEGQSGGYVGRAMTTDIITLEMSAEGSSVTTGSQGLGLKHKQRHLEQLEVPSEPRWRYSYTNPLGSSGSPVGAVWHWFDGLMGVFFGLALLSKSIPKNIWNGYQIFETTHFPILIRLHRQRQPLQRIPTEI